MLYHLIIIINYITRIIEITIKIVPIPLSVIPVKAAPAHAGLTYRDFLTYDVLDEIGEYAGGAHFSGHCKHTVA